MQRTIYSLVSTGEIWEHLQDDVMFAVSNFMDPRTAQRSYSGNLEMEQNQSPDSWITEQTLAARVKVLKELRHYEKQIEQGYHTIAMRVHRALEDMPWANSEEWVEVTTTELCQAVGAKTALDRLCVHKYLMSHHERFIAHPIDFLAAQKFLVRPRSQIENLNTVSQMLARDEAAVQSFIQKAREIVTAHRARQSTSETLSSEPDTSFTFTGEEQAFIRFLQAFVRTTRTTQKDPYVIPVASFMKRLELYDGFEKANQGLVHRFLIELGVVAPWDDPVVKDRPLLSLPSSVRNPPPTSSLGPEEFYPHDIVEHVRHDFKDMNAYVIDDVGAEELDDAVSVERIPSEPDAAWVHVHIADPTLKLHPTHIVSQQARLRYTTSYDIHQTAPMIPSSLMYDGLSLGNRSKQGLPENVLTFSYKVDNRGNIVDYKVRAGLLRNVHVVKYDDVDASLGRAPRKVPTPFDPEPFRYSSGSSLPLAQAEELKYLHEVTRRLVHRRVENGAFFFSIASALVTMDGTVPSNPTDLTHPYLFTGFPKLSYELETQEFEFLGARQMVSEAMQAACRVASRFFRDNGVPAVRRAADPPSLGAHASLEELLQTRREDGLVPYDYIFKMSIEFPRGENTLELKSHFSIGSEEGEGYVRVTSPLRRYGDLVHHWQIKQILAATGAPARPLFSQTWLKDFAAEMTNKEHSLRSIERRHRLFWNFKFIEQWLANAANKDKPSPLDGTEALLVQPIDFDIMYRRAQLRLFLPSLGIFATGDYLGDRMTAPGIGDTVRVKFDSLSLGTNPILNVKTI